MLVPLRRAAPLVALLAASAAACAAADAPRHVTPRASSHETPRASSQETPVAGENAPAALDPGTPRLGLGAARMALPAGSSRVEVELEAGRFVSLLVLGSADALRSFDVLGPPALRPLRAHGPLDEDGLLPRVLSFYVPEGVGAIELFIDVESPVELARASVEPLDDRAHLAPKRAAKVPAFLESTPPLIGLPAPLGREDGYLLQAPNRYQFLRVDVAHALLAAFRKTRQRFRREPIAVADISQWDGRRPATDIGAPRHISHEGGRDVDLGLPASDGGPSTVQARCTGAWVTHEIWLCSPGTARDLDAVRLAYFLGLLLDGSPPGGIAGIFTDEVYIEQIRAAVDTLKERRWIGEAGIEGLLGERVLRPAPWHTDHVHVRFGGPAAAPRF